MRVKLDAVSQHELQQGALAGSIIRTAIININIGELPVAIPDPTMLIKALARPEIPSIGSSYPAPGYDDWVVRRYVLRPVNAITYICLIFYEWLGAIRIRDVSTLSVEYSQIDRATNTPYKLSYLGLRDFQPITKTPRIPIQTPLRHLIFSKTIKTEASVDVLNAYPSVNSKPWQGYPTGFWLFSGIEGESLDNGLTYTYTAIFSSRITRDWSEFDTITNNRGETITFSPAEVEAIRNVIVKTYIYGQNSSADGFLRVGPYPMNDFQALFGV
jgi:hypothetical protein